jgi:hypothetical protein
VAGNGLSDCFEVSYNRRRHATPDRIPRPAATRGDLPVREQMRLASTFLPAAVAARSLLWPILWHAEYD